MKTKYIAMFFALVLVCGISTIYYTIAGEIRDTGGEFDIETDNIISSENKVENVEIIDISGELTIESDQIVSDENAVEDDTSISDYIIEPDGRIYTSDDGRFQAFVSSIDRSRYNNIEVTVVDNSSGAELIIPLSTHSLNLDDVKFIGNSIALTGHVSPSLVTHEIFSLKDGERLSYREGVGFTFDSNNELYYVQVEFPHFSNERGNDRIVNEHGDVLYESEYGVTISGVLHIDEYTIGFYEYSESDRTYKVISKFL